MKQIQGSKDSALLVVINQKGECPLVKKTNHKKPLFRIPGGEVEAGESPLDAVLREFKGETGMEFSSDANIHFLSSEWNEQYGHYYHVFGTFVSNISGLHGAPVPDGDDILEVEILDLADALEYGVMVCRHRNMLRQAVEKLAALC